MLIKLDKNVYVVNGVTQIIGSAMNIRMTIIRLPNGKLIVFDPIPLGITLTNEINSLGQIAFIIAPNNFHYLYISEWSRNYPEAKVLVAPGLPKRIKSMQQYTVISKDSMSELNDQFTWLLFDALPVLNEIILFHKTSRTLLITDLVFNIHKTNWSLLGIYIRFSGTFKKLGLTYLLKFMVKNKSNARVSVNKILSWDFEKIVMAHGNIIYKDGKKLFSIAFKWLLD